MDTSASELFFSPLDPPPPLNTMVRALDIAFAAMCLAIAAVVLVELRDQLPDSGTSTTTTTRTTKTQFVPTTSTQVVPPLAATATGAMFAAVARIFHHLQHRAAAGGDRRFSELVTFMMCASAAILEYVFFVQPAGVIVIDVGARVRALGVAAARMLPAAATVTFFLGMALALVHVRTERGAVAGDGPVGRLLSKMAVEAAAVLVGLMAMALYTRY